MENGPARWTRRRSWTLSPYHDRSWCARLVACWNVYLKSLIILSLPRHILTLILKIRWRWRGFGQVYIRQGPAVPREIQMQRKPEPVRGGTISWMPERPWTSVIVYFFRFV